MATRRVLALANLALAAAATVAALLAVEIGLRVLGVETASYHAIAGFSTYDPELGWRLAPSRETIFKGAHFAVRVTQSASGLRDRPYTYERVPARRRILVLGDSVVWCWGVEQAECFTERLESAFGDTEVINAGVPAYSTAQEVLFYEREGRRYRPDLVLLVLVPNDLVENVMGPRPRFRLQEGRLTLTGVPVARRKSALREWLQAHSRLFGEVDYKSAVVKQVVRQALAAASRRLRPAVAATDPPSAPPQGLTPNLPPEGSKPWLLTEALLDRLAAAAHADGARFAVLLETMPRPMAGWARGWLTARGIPCLDLGPALRAAELRGERVRLVGDPHIAPAGQAVVAAELLAFLEREALLRDTRPGTVAR